MIPLLHPPPPFGGGGVVAWSRMLGTDGCLAGVARSPGTSCACQEESERR